MEKRQKPKNSKKGRKIALLSLYLLYLYHICKSKGGGHGPLAPCFRRPWLWCRYNNRYPCKTAAKSHVPI